MTRAMPEGLQRIQNTGRIKADDTLAVRRAVYSDGAIGPDEAEWLFALNRACPVQDKSWHDLFSEALTDYCVNQMPPEGYISPDNARWLINHLGRDGYVETASGVTLLVNILDKSTSCPEELSAFVLKQVKRAVLEGTGPTRRGGFEAGRVTAADVDLIRRTLYAAGGQQNIAISKPEAEVLFDISDATAGAVNDPAWSDLFVKAIANHIMFASGYQVPSREEALHYEQWRDDVSVDVGGFFEKMARGLSEVFGAYRQDEDDDRRHATISMAERVTDDEARWLASRINRDGKILPHEAAVLSFIKRESPDIHPLLKPLLDKVA